MNAPQTYDSLIELERASIKARLTKLQWYSIVVCYFKDGGWVIEEEVKVPNERMAYLAYNRFLNHYGRYTTYCKINLYEQRLLERRRIEEIIFEK
jgi:hypothetical protein